MCSCLQESCESSGMIVTMINITNVIKLLKNQIRNPMLIFYDEINSDFLKLLKPKFKKKERIYEPLWIF